VVLLVAWLAACQTASPPSSVVSTPTSSEALQVLPLRVGYGLRGGWFELYFTDPANPNASQENGGPDEILASAIDQARLSVEVAIYNLSLPSIRAALIRAANRGVQVRVVMESDNLDRAVPQALMEAGIPVLGDRREGLMHHKFVIIDRSEVWTGSMNLTTSDIYQDNNNLIRIRSVKAAEDYEREFDEMFVEDRFGPHSLVNTPYPHLIIDSTPVEIYFSPDDGIAQHLVALLGQARKSIYFMAYSFTLDELGKAMRQRARNGVKVSGVMEDNQVRANVGGEYDPFRQAGLDVRLDGNPGLMHHKVIVIDDQIVITGSYNFSNNAETSNDENLIVIYNSQIAAQYLEEFQRVYAQTRP
jgi:phosphatidylserine/phosphatidylglycerophosphate/cardiolipin synthase-like enzyme